MAGEAVRLQQGDPSRRIAAAGDPVALALRWADEGARWLHVVDLDGALAGSPRHLDVVERICDAVPVPVQYGGGLRSLQDIGAAIDAGASRVILGTAAFDGDVLQGALARFGGRIAAALDARDGAAAVEGWRRISPLSVLDAARRLSAAGVARFVYTDVARDGMVLGPDLEGLRRLRDEVAVPVILSGGVGTPEDVRAAAVAGAEGVIVGRALYERRITLAQALAAAGERG
jgi:phosphoribosylformimino-5-aminoimidazole carboxamide ribotide isomerase